MSFQKTSLMKRSERSYSESKALRFKHYYSRDYFHYCVHSQKKVWLYVLLRFSKLDFRINYQCEKLYLSLGPFCRKKHLKTTYYLIHFCLKCYTFPPAWHRRCAHLPQIKLLAVLLGNEAILPTIFSRLSNAQAFVTLTRLYKTQCSISRRNFKKRRGILKERLANHRLSTPSHLYGRWNISGYS